MYGVVWQENQGARKNQWEPEMSRPHEFWEGAHEDPTWRIYVIQEDCGWEK